MKNNNKPALLFDLDGTLIDSIELILSSMEHAFSGREKQPNRAEWVAGIGTPLRAQLSPWCSSETDMEAVISRYRDYQNEHLEQLTVPYPGLLRVLTWAREYGCPIALVTSKGRTMTTRSLEHVGISALFDTVVTAEDTTAHKPRPEPVWLALERLSAASQHALFVGDSPHDMYAGRSAGVKTAAALWGPFSKEMLLPATPDYWLTSLSELPEIIRRLN